MAAGYQVVLRDLAGTAAAYHRRAAEYRTLKPQVTPAPADGGDPAFNDALATIMDDLDSLHTKLADRIDEHGDKLQYAHDSYQRHEVDVHGVFEDLMPDGG